MCFAAFKIAHWNRLLGTEDFHKTWDMGTPGKSGVPRVRVGTPGKVRAASSGHTLEAQQINKEEKK